MTPCAAAIARPAAAPPALARAPARACGSCPGTRSSGITLLVPGLDLPTVTTTGSKTSKRRVTRSAAPLRSRRRSASGRRVVRHRGVTAAALDAYLPAGRRRRAAARAATLTLPAGASGMTCSANAPGPAPAGVEQAVLEHEAGAVAAFLARLEHEHDLAGQRLAARGEQPGGAGQHRGVRRRGRRRASRPHLEAKAARSPRHRQRVHVAAQQDAGPGAPPRRTAVTELASLPRLISNGQPFQRGEDLASGCLAGGARSRARGGWPAAQVDGAVGVVVGGGEQLGGADRHGAPLSAPLSPATSLRGRGSAAQARAGVVSSCQTSTAPGFGDGPAGLLLDEDAVRAARTTSRPGGTSTLSPGRDPRQPQPRVGAAAGRPSPSRAALAPRRTPAPRPARRCAGSTAGPAPRRPRRSRRASAPSRPAGRRRPRRRASTPPAQLCRSEPARTTATTSTSRCSCRPYPRARARAGRRRSAAAGRGNRRSGPARSAGRGPSRHRPQGSPALGEGTEGQCRQQGSTRLRATSRRRRRGGTARRATCGSARRGGRVRRRPRAPSA